MINFRNIEEALRAINDEAAADAWAWLEREKPQTANAIRYLIQSAKWKPDAILDQLSQLYGDTEPNARHKMRLAVEALAREGDG